LKSLVFDANKTDIFPEKPTNVESIHGQTSLLRWALPLLSGLVVPTPGGIETAGDIIDLINDC
jgi:hypothetical protein